MARDPVCEMDVDEDTTTPQSQYKGTTYYFCCDACKEAFDRNPEKFVSRRA